MLLWSIQELYACYEKEYQIMRAVLSTEKASLRGSKARMLRVVQLLTQEELAHLADVSPEEVDLFERNLPVRLDVRRRVLKALWARKD